MTPKAAKLDALLEARTAHEQTWALELWMGRHTWAQMRRLAGAPPEKGGLGYDLSESALKGLVAGAREARGDLTMGRAERIERQAAEVDERARAARHDFAAAYERVRALDAAIVEAPDAETVRDLVAQRAGVAADLERADRRLDAVHAREARLFGLDQPAELEVKVTQHDALVDELNAQLARAGKKPIPTPEGKRS